jgi:hypothetical protein
MFPVFPALNPVARRSRNPSSADFQVCCVAGFQTRRLRECGRSADLEVGDTAGLETCATKAGGRCLEKSSRLVTILTDSSAKGRGRVATALRGFT